MKRIIVLGGGMVGKAMAVDLSTEHTVTVADINPDRLEEIKSRHSLQTLSLDASNEEALREAVKDYDLVVGSVPGFMGYSVLKTVIEAGKDVVDISFFDEDPFQLDEPARERNVTAITDCGVAPGMSNVILGHHNKSMEIDFFECLVGGLPVKRNWPYQYKAPFSPIDVFEEYLRPARMVENGKVVIRQVLSGTEHVDIDPVGTLESSNTDGLRTLLRTMNIPNMKEKTLRYPGHFEYIRVLKESGFFDKEPIEVGGVSVRPIDVTAKLLFPKWRLSENEPEITVMRIVIRGVENGKQAEYTYRLFDRFDEKTGTSSMARTTGYACTGAARLILEGKFKRKGICPPEILGATPGCFDAMMKHMEERGIHYAREKRALKE